VDVAHAVVDVADAVVVVNIIRNLAP